MIKYGMELNGGKMNKEILNKKILHEKDDLFAILFINFLTTRLTHYIIENKIKITPNQISYLRMFLIAPIIILFLFLAPLYGNLLFYLGALVFCYLFIVSDWLDGQLARGTNKTSLKGAFLDSIADRCSTILFIVFLFSSGLWFSNNFLIYGSVCLFTLKSFHLMIITKLFYFGIEKGKNNFRVFDGHDTGINKINIIFKKVNKVLKIKNWGGTFGGSERFFITIMLPLILLLLGLVLLTKILLITYILLYSIFFIIRTKNLFQNIK